MSALGALVLKNGKITVIGANGASDSLLVGTGIDATIAGLLSVGTTTATSIATGSTAVTSISTSMGTAGEWTLVQLLGSSMTLGGVTQGFNVQGPIGSWTLDGTDGDSTIDAGSGNFTASGTGVNVTATSVATFAGATTNLGTNGATTHVMGSNVTLGDAGSGTVTVNHNFAVTGSIQGPLNLAAPASNAICLTVNGFAGSDATMTILSPAFSSGNSLTVTNSGNGNGVAVSVLGGNAITTSTTGGIGVQVVQGAGTAGIAITITGSAAVPGITVAGQNHNGGSFVTHASAHASITATNQTAGGGSGSTASVLELINSGDQTTPACTINAGSTPGTATYIQFYTGITIPVAQGLITWNGSNTVYGTGSDARIKTNVKPIEGALAMIMKLEPCTFDMISSNQPNMGFIAQAVHEAGFAHAVHVGDSGPAKDLVPVPVLNKEGDPVVEAMVRAVIDASGKPMLDRNGKTVHEPILDAKGRPMMRRQMRTKGSQWSLDASLLVAPLTAAFQQYVRRTDARLAVLEEINV